jgi:hypothetical protein
VSNKGRRNASGGSKGFAPTPTNACTPTCTNNQETANADPLAALAAKLAVLSPEDRARLAAMLAGNPQGEGNGSGIA